MKNFINKIKRGFTLVELAIVIAVIAILVAVLVPTFIALIENANKSNDMVTVKNLNTAVSIEDASGNINTPSDAIDAALANGYSVGSLTPTSDGNYIVYDQTAKRFALINEEDGLVYGDSATTKKTWADFGDYTTWFFISTTDSVVTTVSENNYTLTGSNSYILTGESWNNATVTATYGVELYDYTNTISLASVTITNNDTPSSADSGIELAKTGIKNATAENTDSEVTAASIIINVKAGSLAYTGKAYAVANHSKVTTATNIDAGKGNTFNSYGTSGQYITTSGTLSVKYIDDVTVITIGEGATESDISIDLTSLSSEEVKNIYPSETINEIIKSLSSNLTIPDSNILESDNVELTVNEETSLVEIKVSVTEGETTTSYTFTKENVSSDSVIELGTEKYPYRIAELDDFDTLRTLIDNDATEGVYFKLVNDIDLGYDWQPLGTIIYTVQDSSAKIYSDYCKKFNGTFDGDNHSITMHDTTAFEGEDIDYIDYALFAYVSDSATIKNLTVDMDVKNSATFTCGGVASYVNGYGTNNITLENITITGTITAVGFAGGVVGWAARDCTFKNCVNKANITTTGGSISNGVGYTCIGGISAQAGNATDSVVRSVVFENCTNTGALTHSCEDTDTVDYYSIIGSITAQLANNSLGYSCTCTLTFTNCSGTGTISGLSKTESGDEKYYFTTDSSNTTQWLIGYCNAITPTVN